MIWFVLGFIVGGVVVGWAVWSDLYYLNKSYFDKKRERERWKKS